MRQRGYIAPAPQRLMEIRVVALSHGPHAEAEPLQRIFARCRQVESDPGSAGSSSIRRRVPRHRSTRSGLPQPSPASRCRRRCHTTLFRRRLVGLRPSLETRHPNRPLHLLEHLNLELNGGHGIGAALQGLTCAHRHRCIASTCSWNARTRIGLGRAMRRASPRRAGLREPRRRPCATRRDGALFPAALPSVLNPAGPLDLRGDPSGWKKRSVPDKAWAFWRRSTSPSIFGTTHYRYRLSGALPSRKTFSSEFWGGHRLARAAHALGGEGLRGKSGWRSGGKCPDRWRSPEGR
jgi:hypothetical protein